MRVGIRADGGDAIGFGHLVRTSALATECLRRGDEVIYFSTTPDAVTTILEDSIIVKKVQSVDDPAEVVQLVDTHGVDTLFVDLFEADTEYQQRLSKTDMNIVIRHNYLNHKVSCDTLVYGDLHAPGIEYEWIGEKPEFLLGPDFILLREQFQKASQKRYLFNKNPNRALISMGGSDIAGVTPEVMKAFHSFSGTVDVVVGPGFSNRDEIERMAQSVPTQFEILYSPENMAELMLQADIAVSAVGGTVFELLATRTPFVGVLQAENQVPRAEVLRQERLAPIVSSCKDIISEVKMLLQNNDERRVLFQRMEGVVDGFGAKRIYENAFV